MASPDPAIYSRRSPKSSILVVMTLERIYELLGVDYMPGDQMDLQDLERYSTELAFRHGEEWLRENRGRLVEEWYYLVTL